MSAARGWAYSDAWAVVGSANKLDAGGLERGLNFC